MGESKQQRADVTLFQHNDFIITYKPDGVDCHDSQGETGFFNQLNQLAEQQLYPVHRLDKVTSGIVILAKTAQAAAEFERLFRQRLIEKRYIALAQGKPTKKQGWVKGDMQKSRRGAWKLLRSQQNPAITYFHSQSLGDGLRGYILHPKSGKTHQLRVAMKSLGTPIVGDLLYGDKQHMQQFDRTYLHALAIKFDWFGEVICQLALPQSGALFSQAKTEEWVNSIDLSW